MACLCTEYHLRYSGSQVVASQPEAKRWFRTVTISVKRPQNVFFPSPFHTKNKARLKVGMFDSGYFLHNIGRVKEL
jgi:hypothetical protein